MVSDPNTERRNFRFHLIEGALYVSSGALHSAQTLYPALIKELGGSNLAIGGLHVVVFLAFFLPQLVAAHYTTRFEYRKPWVLTAGLLQRLQILVMAVVVASFGVSLPGLALFCVFFVYANNQVLSGIASPAWYDLVAKTVKATNRGKLIGLRTSIGALIGFFNGLLLTVLLATLRFPYNYASAIGLAFVYQMASLFVLRKVVEDRPSVVVEPVRLTLMLQRARAILNGDRRFLRFLVASSLLTVGLSPVAFFTVAALKKFNLGESYVGLFTILSLGAQMMSSALLGWVADRKGTKVSLMISAGSLCTATSLALVSPSVIYYYAVFVFTGINLGAEMLTRYNFAVECASEENRPMYVGLMNAWFAPFYLFGLLGGWMSDQYGYESVFVGALVFLFAGIVVLAGVQDPRRPKLALSSK
ncbi:MAG: MFS transporter [Bacteroidota bacterium]